MRFFWLRRQASLFTAHAIRRKMKLLQSTLDHSLAQAAFYKGRMESEKRTHPSLFTAEERPPSQPWDSEGEQWKDTPSP
jgi:hypothetical protein